MKKPMAFSLVFIAIALAAFAQSQPTPKTQEKSGRSKMNCPMTGVKSKRLAGLVN